MIYIGIDPGLSGGIAAVYDSGVVLDTVYMPSTQRDVLETLEKILDVAGTVATRAVLEHVWSIPGQGGAFKFGRNVGHLEMALTASRIPFDQVIPRAWQKALGVAYPKGITDTEKKNITKRRAQQIFPDYAITHAIADALLIAEYCRRINRGMVGGEANGKKEGAGAQQTSEARRIGPGQIIHTGVDVGKGKDRTVVIDPLNFGRTFAGTPRHGAGPKRKAR